MSVNVKERTNEVYTQVISDIEAILPFPIYGITSGSVYKSNRIKDCKLDAYNEIQIGNQILIPRYKRPDERQKENKTLSFYESGKLKSIALEERTEITTSLGKMSVELITFYESGEIDSVFPVNGQIGFGWSLEDEEQLLEDMTFTFPFGDFLTKIIGIRFYPSGKVKSMILWPKKQISIHTPIGEAEVRIGFRLYEDGQLQSFEPAMPISIETPIGKITAFDQHALGIDADVNSIVFSQKGELLSLKTNSDIVVQSIEKKERTLIYQQFRLDMTTDEMIKLPIEISFQKDQVCFYNGIEHKTFSIQDSKFLFLYDGYYSQKKCSPGSDCSDCGSACM